MEKIITKTNTGSRKTARSMVVLKENGGSYIVNGKSIKEYFKEDRFIEDVLRPLKVLESNLGFVARVKGGGISAQSCAVRHALSKLLTAGNVESKRKLKVLGFIKRDYRRVERKKCGRYKSRAKFPFSRR